MKSWVSLIMLVIFSFVANALHATDLKVTAKTTMPIMVSITVEKVEFHETLGIGLADTKYDHIGTIDFKKVTEKTINVVHDAPVLANLTIAPQAGASQIVARTYPLYLTPDEQLTIVIGIDGKPSFVGTSATRQNFLSNYFLENHYQHLPALGYRPSQPEFAAIHRQIDSLQTLRKRALSEYMASQPTEKGFQEYIKARLMTEPYLLETFIAEKKMRLQRAKRLSPQEQNTIDQFTLDQFLILEDEALLSKSYRDELRHWIQIPVVRRFPQDTTYQQPIQPEAVKAIYEASQQKLANFPRQKAYLATYWLNYATTALPTTAVASELLNHYKASYPQSDKITYFSNLLEAKQRLQAGQIAPPIAFFLADSTNSSLTAQPAKPICLVFAFNLKQFENDLHRLEERYSNQVQFIYLNVSPSIPFTFWKKNTAFRPRVQHVWANATQIEEIKQRYVIEPRFPFVIIDQDKKIVQRWIQQEFPHNTALEKALQQVAR